MLQGRHSGSLLYTGLFRDNRHQNALTPVPGGRRFKRLSPGFLLDIFKEVNRQRVSSECRPLAPAFGLLLGDFQTVVLPDPFHPAIADRPTGLAQQDSNLPVAVGAILLRQSRSHAPPVVRHPLGRRDLALCRAVLPQRRTDQPMTLRMRVEMKTPTTVHPRLLPKGYGLLYNHLQTSNVLHARPRNPSASVHLRGFNSLPPS